MDKYPEVELLDHMVILYIFNFLRNSILFAFPPTVYKCFLLSASLPTLISYLFDNSHSDGCKVMSLCGFNMHFPQMATHSGTLAWKISWMGEPGRLQSMELQTVGHD